MNDAFKLSEMQEAYLVGKEITKEESVGCHIYFEFEENNLDCAKIKKTWNILVKNHDMLRARINGDGTQLIEPFEEYDIQVFEANSDNKWEIIENNRRKMSHKVYSTNEYPLYEICITHDKNGSSIIHFSIDEWIVDASSVAILLNQWYELYHDLNITKPFPQYTFKEYLAFQNDRSINFKDDLIYWKKKLNNLNEYKFELFKANETIKKERIRLSRHINKSEWKEIIEQANNKRISPAAVLFTCFLDAIYYFNNENSFSVITTYHNRMPVNVNIDNVVGPFISTQIFVCDERITSKSSFWDRALGVQEQMWDDYDHSSFGGVRILRELKRIKNINSRYSIPVVFTSMLNNVRKKGEKTFYDQINYNITQTPQVYLDHQLTEVNDELIINWDINKDSFVNDIGEAVFEKYIKNVLDLCVLKTSVKNKNEEFSLTDLQRSYEISSKLNNQCDEERKVYQEFTVKNDNEYRIKQRIEEYVGNTEMLNVIFVNEHQQKISNENVRFEAQIIDLSTEYVDKESIIDVIRQEMINYSFSLYNLPKVIAKIIKISSNIIRVCICVDSSVSDGRSLNLMYEYIFGKKRYKEEKTSFKEILKKKGEYKIYGGYEKDIEYWNKRRMQIFDGPFADRIDPHKKKRTINRLCLRLNVFDALKEYVYDKKISIDSFLATCFIDTLKKSTTGNFTILNAMWDRSNLSQDENEKFGELSTLGFISSTNEKISFEEELSEVEKQIMDDFEHSMICGLFSDNEYHSMTVIYTSVDYSWDLPDNVDYGYGLSKTPGIYLDNISFIERNNLIICWDYDAEFFDKNEIKELFECYRNKIEKCITMNNKTKVKNKEMYIHNYIEENAKKYPYKTAVKINDDETTYAELNEKANKLAAYLHRQNANKNDLIGLCIDRSINMIISIIGILKAGCAYVPIDPQYPIDRIRHIINDSKVRIIITEKETVSNTVFDNCKTIYLDLLENDISNESGENNDYDKSVPAEQSAYVIYTSGSTGKPKGVLITHNNVVRLMSETYKWYSFNEKDIWTMFHSFAFDFSVWEIWGALFYGGELIIVPYNTSRSFSKMYELLEREKVTVLNQTPTAFNQIMKVEEEEGQRELSLRFIIFGGEALNFASLAGWYSRHKKDSTQLINMYGITETTVHVTYRPICADDIERKESLIGTPISDLRLYLLDENLNMVNDGEIGEICISGPGVSKGYLYNEELTQPKFVNNPFEKGSLLYLSGDLGRRVNENDIEYMGRKDKQVKIRGFRIEIGEIENALLKHHDIEQAAVSVIGTEDNKEIKAFVVSNNDQLSAKEIRKFIRNMLPVYMIPSQIEKIKEFPLTKNGKLDYSTLFAEKKNNNDNNENDEKNDMITKEEIREILQSELAETIGYDDDIFDLGATSLTIVNCIKKIRVQKELSIDAEVFLEYPTINEMIDQINNKYLEGYKSNELDNKSKEELEKVFIIGNGNKNDDILVEEKKCFSNTIVSMKKLSKLMEALKEKTVNGKRKYLYASAGGKNAVQTYVYIKENKVEGINEGIYYYNQEDNSLYLISNENKITENVFPKGYKELFRDAAFAIFFIGAMEAIEPVYLDFSESLVNIDGGYMQQLLSTKAKECDINLCIVPDIEFERIKNLFKISDKHCFISTMLGGSMPSDNDKPLEIDEIAAVQSLCLKYDRISVDNFRSINKKMEYNQLSRKEVVELARKKLHIRRVTPDNKKIKLYETNIPDSQYINRSSKRSFLPEGVKFSAFEHLLSFFNENTINGNRTRTYHSIGNRYCIEIYIYVKKDGIIGVDEGLYRYVPEKQQLIFVNNISEKEIEHCHTPFNRPHFKDSQFSIFLILNIEESLRVYGSGNLKYTIMESGRIGQVLTSKQSKCGLGIVPIGGLNFDKIKKQFLLDDNYMVLHSFTCGGYSYERNTYEETDEIIHKNDISIIGYSYRFADAENEEEYWQLLKDKKTAISDLPEKRKSLWKKKDIDPHDYMGAYIHDIEMFDYEAFNISLAEAKTIDPQERLMLEETMKCLEKAGYTKENINKNHKVGVFIGSMWGDYEKYAIEEWEKEQKADIVSLHSSIANRISYVFDFKGPSVSVQTACSSSITAFSLACDSLLNNKCSMAIVGGVNIISHPYHYDALRGKKILSSSPTIEIYSEDISGMGIGEGVGVVLLKKYENAQSDNDMILANIKNVKIACYGKSKHFGMVSLEEQIKLFQDLLNDSLIDPKDIGYIETSATGLAVSDVTEYNAISDVFNTGSGKCYLSTVKPNIGHLEAASFIAQLIKVLLQIKHNVLVPSIYASTITPAIDIENSRFVLPEMSINGNKKSIFKYAVINSFGAYGSIGSTLVEAINEKVKKHRNTRTVVLLGSDKKEKLDGLIKLLIEYIRNNKDVNLNDIAYTFSRRARNFKNKIAVIASDIKSIVLSLEYYLNNDLCGVLIENGAISTSGSFDELTMAGLNWIENNENVLNTNNGNIIDIPNTPLSKERCWFDECKESENSSNNDEVYDWLLNEYSKISQIPVEKLDLDTDMEELGLSSMIIMELNKVFERRYSIKEPTMMFDVKTLRELGNYISSKSNCTLKKNQGINDKHVEESNDERFAIIGVSGIYPDAENLDEFWENIKNGVISIREVPKERWDINEYYDPKNKGKAYGKWGGFIPHMECFDSLFFNISPKEAELMDPQERKFIEVAYHTFEDAGYSKKTIKERLNGRIGVFVGAMFNDYLLYSGKKDENSYQSTGAVSASISNRISYFLNLNGPSMTVNTMCSSVISCLDLAINSIKNGECDAALVGGVNLIVHPNKYIMHSHNRMLSDDGLCRAFGKGGNGFVPAEGVGAILIKPLKNAEDDNDKIYAVIRGVGVNHGGKSNGYMVPNSIAQADLIESMLRKAKIKPEDIGYVEAHGTGTELGDPIEIKGLTSAYSKFTDKKGYCPIGSVKANIGHCESAAGIASITKILLQIKNRQIVPNVLNEELNENIDFNETPFYIPKQLMQWRSNDLLRASVSSFGAGGVNGYAIIEEYVDNSLHPKENTTDENEYLFLISAPTKDGIKKYLFSIYNYLKSKDLEYIIDSIISEVTEINIKDIDNISTLKELGIGHQDLIDIKEKICKKFNFKEATLDINLHTSIESICEKIDTFKQSMSSEYSIKNITYTMYCRRSDFAKKVAIKCQNIHELLFEIEKCLSSDSYIEMHSVEYSMDINNMMWNNAKIVSLPGYPFNEKKYWISENYKKNEEQIMKKQCTEELQFNLSNIIESVLKLDINTINDEDDLNIYGMDSIRLAEVCELLNKKYNIEIVSAELMSCNTIKDMEEVLKHKFSATENLNETAIVQKSNEGDEHNIAIIGMSGMTSGALNLAGFWNNLISKKSSLRDCPNERKELIRYIETGKISEAKLYGGYVDNIDLWDPIEYGISPNEAVMIDPQQRLFLDMTSAALYDAGINKDEISGKHIGVFVGCSGSDYEKLINKYGKDSAHSVLGTSHAVIANRVSYFYNLKGPSEVIDTTCSSSLVAINRAVKAIRAGECEMAIVGGINLIITPEKFKAYDEAGMLAEDKNIRVFSESGKGFLRGEGVGCVILKRIDKAIEESNRIYSVIKGCAVNHNGKTMNITMPGLNAQQDVIIRACEDAQISPNAVEYIEAQGSGNSTADLVEWKAYSNTYGNYIKDNKVKVSFIKGNVGHLEAASGIFAIIKASMALYNMVIPAALGHDCDFGKKHNNVLSILSENENLDEKSTIAAVHSYGIGGVNAHIILESMMHQSDTFDDEKSESSELFLLGGESRKQIKDNVCEIIKYIEKNEHINIASIAETLFHYFKNSRFRKYIISSTANELYDKLIELKNSENILWAVDSGIVNEEIKNVINEKYIEYILNNSLDQNDYDSIGRLWTGGFNIQRFMRKNSTGLISFNFKPIKKSYWITTNEIESGSQHNFKKDIIYEDKLKSIVSDVSGISKDEIDENKRFLDMGFDSILLAKLKYFIEEKIGIEIKTKDIGFESTIKTLGEKLHPEHIFPQ